MRFAPLLFALLLLGAAVATPDFDEPTLDEDENDSFSDQEEDLDMMTTPTFTVPQGKTVKNYKCSTHNTDTDYVFQEFRISWSGTIPRGSQFQIFDSKGEIASSGEAICGAWIDIYQGKLKHGFCPATGKIDIASQLFYIEKPGVYGIYYQQLYDLKLGYLRHPGTKIGSVTITNTNCNTPVLKVGSSAESSEESESSNTVSASSASSSPACSARKGLCARAESCVGSYYTDPLGCAAGTVCCDGKIRQ